MLYRYIREENPPPFTAMVGLSKASGVSLDYLASGEGPLYKDESVAEDGSPYKADEKPLQERLTAATNAILKAPESDRSEAGELAVIFVRDLVLLGALKADAASDVISHIASQLRSRRNTPATDI